MISIIQCRRLLVAFAFMSHCCVMFNLLSSRTPGPPSQSCFPVSQHQHALLHGGIPPQMEDFAFPFVELYEVSVSPSLHPGNIPANGNNNYLVYQLIFPVLYHLWEFAVVLSSSLKKLNSINSWVNQEQLGLHVDSVLLITTLQTSDIIWWKSCTALYEFCI